MVNRLSPGASAVSKGAGTRLVHTRHVQALWQLSGAPNIPPQAILKQIQQAPDPETAVRDIFRLISVTSEALQRKWRELIYNVWSEGHPNIPLLINLPFKTGDVTETAALSDARVFLQTLAAGPLRMAEEEGEWLLAPEDAYQLSLRLPSLASRPKIPLENEWQYHTVRRQRATLEALHLVRRVKGQLRLVQSRYQRFSALPVAQQFYYLWHAEAYHVEWSAFAGIWSDYLDAIQENISLLWQLTDRVIPDMPYDLRHYLQELWDAYYPLWEDEGLIGKHHNYTALMSIVRIHSLPTALTQLIIKDLLERYGLMYGEGDKIAYTELGVSLLSAEQGDELPCALDLLN